LLLLYKFKFYELLNNCPLGVIILDLNRQIIAANKSFLKLIGEKQIENILGKRLGEALNCIHRDEMEAGCGTSIFCKECGAAKAIKNAKETSELNVFECRINSKKNDFLIAYDLKVYVSKFAIKGFDFLLVYLKDISFEKQKKIFERVFFHDILNLFHVIKNLTDILIDKNNQEDLKEILELLELSNNYLFNEIIFHRNISLAENRELKIEKEFISANLILKETYNLFYKEAISESKLFTVTYLEKDVTIETNKSMVVRSLQNLVKNAFEATKKDDRIRLFAEIDEKQIYFKVWNERVIPENIQAQIFQKSFSTKAEEGRGIGTYSVKLFIENYLNGKVFFISNEKEQTCFTIALPRAFSEKI